MRRLTTEMLEVLRADATLTGPSDAGLTERAGVVFGSGRTTGAGIAVASTRSAGRVEREPSPAWTRTTSRARAREREECNRH